MKYISYFYHKFQYISFIHKFYVWSKFSRIKWDQRKKDFCGQGQVCGMRDEKILLVHRFSFVCANLFDWPNAQNLSAKLQRHDFSFTHFFLSFYSKLFFAPFLTRLSFGYVRDLRFLFILTYSLHFNITQK